MSPNCPTCQTLKDRVDGLSRRIRNQKTWDQNQSNIRRAAYQLVLASIERHMRATGHEVDSFPVLQALGLRVKAA